MGQRLKKYRTGLCIMPLRSAQDFGKLIWETWKASKVTQKELVAACGTGIRFIRELRKEKPVANWETGCPNARY